MNLRNKLPFFLAYAQQKPSKPTFLEYVEFDGDSYIDTGIKTGNSIGVEIEAMSLSTTAQYHAMGYFSNDESSANYAIFGSADGYIQAGVNTDRIRAVGYAWANKRRVCKLNKGKFYVDNTFIGQVTPDITKFNNIWVGAINNIAKHAGRVYEAKITDNDILIQDLRPALDPRGVVCFYDTVTKTYFYNQGTGELKAGEPLAEHEELEYLEFDGTKYIDILFKPHPRTTRIVLDCMLLDNVSAGGQGVFGARPTITGSVNAMNLWFNTSDANKMFRLDCTGDSQLRSDVIDITQRLHVDCLDNKATVNGVTYSSSVDKSGTTYIAYSMYLGNFNNAGNPYTKGCKMNCYGFAVYDNSMLVRDMIPVKRSDGVKCMYDRVENKYYELATI